MYKNRDELQAFMIKDGDNWILSAIHNKPHEALEDSCDTLKFYLDNLASKLGIDPAQQKFDGFPIYYRTHFIKTGMTFTEALSRLDTEVKLLEDKYKNILYSAAYFGANRWIVSAQEIPKRIITVPSSADTPAPLIFTNFGTSVCISYITELVQVDAYVSRKGAIWTTPYNNIETNWIPPTIVSKGERTTSGEITNIIIPASRSDLVSEVLFSGTFIVLQSNTSDPTAIRILYICGASDSVPAADRTPYSLKGSFSTVASSGQITVDTDDDTTIISNRTTGGNVLNGFPRFVQTFRYGDYSYIYIIPTSNVEGDTYSTRKTQRSFQINTIQTLKYDHKEQESKALSKSLQGNVTIEGIDGSVYLDSASYMDMVPIESNMVGMVLVDRPSTNPEEGNIIFRKSLDGYNWFEPYGSVDYGIVQRAITGYRFDYPTFAPVATGYICFFCTNYDYATSSNIFYALSKDWGASWYVPSEQLDILGTFPKLVKMPNGSLYLLYWGEAGDGIYQVKINVSTGRVTTEGGATPL